MYSGNCPIIATQHIQAFFSQQKVQIEMGKKDDIGEELLILTQAVNKFGLDNQYIILIEELAELQKAITKLLRDPEKPNLEAVFEEIADVEIMLTQIKIGFYPKSIAIVNGYKKEKLKRLKELMKHYPISETQRKHT